MIAGEPECWITCMDDYCAHAGTAKLLCPPCEYGETPAIAAYREARAGRAEPLDVETLALALTNEDGPASAWCRNDLTSAEFAERIAAEYARLRASASTDEGDREA